MILRVTSNINLVTTATTTAALSSIRSSGYSMYHRSSHAVRIVVGLFVLMVVFLIFVSFVGRFVSIQYLARRMKNTYARRKNYGPARDFTFLSVTFDQVVQNRRLKALRARPDAAHNPFFAPLDF